VAQYALANETSTITDKHVRLHKLT